MTSATRPTAICRASGGSRTASSACAGPRSPTTAACCRSRSPGTRSSCGRRSGVSTSSTSPSTMDGSPTKKGDVIYLTNVMRMPDGRMWSNSSRFLPDPKYKIPMMKIVIGDDAPDNSVLPGPTKKLRDLPAAAVELADAARRPADLRAAAGLGRWRDRVAHQRKGVRPRSRGGQPEEQGRPPVLGDAEEELLQPLGDPQRRRRLGAPLPPAHGRAPDRHAEQQGRHRQRRPRAPRRQVQGRPRRARPLASP